MNEELESLYRESAKPFVEGGGAITEREVGMRSWRYFLEINSACNLACPTCTKGNKEGYDHQTGIMDWDLMLRCLDKIKAENPEAIVFLYGNSEPFLHPRLAECIVEGKKRGLNCQISSNLNYIRNEQAVKDVLASGLDFMIISLSGFTQEVYVKGHAGGHIDRVKENMALLGDLKYKAGDPFPVSVNYHVYNDNAHEIELMKQYAADHNIGFFTSKARAISMENSIQYMRQQDKESTAFEVQPGRPDWNHAFPAMNKYTETMQRLLIPPDLAREMYRDIPLATVCPVGAGSMFTFIRHDGKTQLCACTADRRIILGNYLEQTPEQMIEKRTGHAICQQCLKYRLNLYFHIVDYKQWI